MKKLILFLFLSTSLFCFGQGKSALKDIQSIKFYGVDYSQVKIFGADEFYRFSTHWRHLYLGNVLCRFKIDAWRHSDFRTEQIFNLFGKGFATVLASDTNQNLIRSQFIGINFNDIVFYRRYIIQNVE